MAEGKNHLELYLHDVYENECMYKIEKAEVDFIQQGVETLVLRIVDKILVYDPIWNEIEQDLVSFRSEGGYITRCHGNIIKVGSFYEGTRNSFPDEFDLIYPFYCCEETKCMDDSLKQLIQRILNQTYEVISKWTHTLHKTEDTKDLYYASCDGMNKLYFDKYLGRSRPAVTMNFVYKSKSGLCKDINVDLVPVAIIKDINLKEIVDKYCGLEPFREEVMLMGQILMVDQRITFTETEVHIMRDMLSQNHRKIYRILKFLIIGNDNGYGKLSSRLPMKCYSSYMIKTLIIYHHFTCTKHDIVDLGPCMIDILNEMCSCKDDHTFPSLLQVDPYRYGKRKKLFLLDDLQAMMNSFLLMQKSNEGYAYTTYRKGKSLSAQHFYDHCRPKCTDDEFDEEELEKVGKLANFLLNFGK